MQRVRDTQRAKVYRADRALDPLSLPIKTISEIEDFVAKAWKSKRLQAAFPRALRQPPPSIRDGRGCTIARGGETFLTLPKWARTEGIIIHELAHTITRRERGLIPAAHGWEFCATYLTITLHVMGRMAHDALKAAFKKHRVRYTAPRKGTPLTPERKARMVAQLAQARTKTVNDALVTALSKLYHKDQPDAL